MPKFTTTSSRLSIPTLNVLMGVAGHIDHGKTELVKMLTGCDTDRLKEEKERGMSIEVGYAPCYVESGRFGIVDVPGHERFVRKMVAGATGIDLALLVVAADDGIMPQTREHLDVIELLGIRQLIIAITKIDLVSVERREQVHASIQEFMQSTSFPHAPILYVSSLTGEGLDGLRNQVTKTIQHLQRKKTDGVFRMPIDRVFSSQGHGTVVTGMASSGSVHVGDRVEILPLRETVRVRGLQVYLSDTDAGTAGQCIALNVTGIPADKIQRGFTVAAPDRFQGVHTFTVHLKASRFLRDPIPNSARIHFHTGTSETSAKIRLLEDDELEANAETFAQVFLDEPVCAFLRDRFILRWPSPARTIAGGTVIDITNKRLKRKNESVLVNLKERWNALPSNSDLLLSLLNAEPMTSLRVDELVQMSGLPEWEVHQCIQEYNQKGIILYVNDSALCSRKSLHDASEHILQVLLHLHASQPNRYSFSFADIQNHCKMQTGMIHEALRYAEKQENVLCKNESYRAVDAPEIDSQLSQLAYQLEQILDRERFQTSSPKQLAEAVRQSLKKVEAALHVLVERGRVKRLAENVYLHDKHIQWAQEQLVQEIEKTGSFETHKFKHIIGSSRKYAIPLLDYFDSIGLTHRQGPVRILNK